MEEHPQDDRGTMYHVLIVSNNSVGQEIRQSLEQEDYAVELVGDAHQPLSFVTQRHPSAVLLDYTSLNKEDAAEILGECQANDLPVLSILARASLTHYDVTRQGDDFLTVPCDPTEITARVRQFLWHVNGDASQTIIRFGDLRIALESYEVSLRGRPVLLTYKEYQLLVLLASNPGHVYSRDVLLNHIWGYDYIGGSRTVDVHVRRLRSKLGEGQHPFVETIWNVGYRFRPHQERQLRSKEP